MTPRQYGGKLRRCKETRPPIQVRHTLQHRNVPSTCFVCVLQLIWDRFPNSTSMRPLLTCLYRQQPAAVTDMLHDSPIRIMPHAMQPSSTLRFCMCYSWFASLFVGAQHEMPVVRQQPRACLGEDSLHMLWLAAKTFKDALVCSAGV